MDSNPIVDALFKAGAQYGYSKSRRHPSVKKYIYTTRNQVDIIDVEATAMQLEKALSFVSDLAKSGKKILFVGVKPEAKDLVKNAAESIGAPFVTERWVGGVLTNQREIKKRIAKLEDLKKKKESGELEKYTKKERLLIDEEIANMHKLFSGLVGFSGNPDALFVIDPKREHIAVTEAKKTRVPIIALANSDCNITGIQFPIIANDASMSSIGYFVEAVVSTYKNATKQV